MADGNRDLSHAPLPRGPRILMYHSISPVSEPDPHSLRVHPDLLDRQLSYLRRRGLRGVSMAEWLSAARRGDTSGLVALTFDDGYRDFNQWAMPVLSKHGMTGTVYVVAGKLSGSSDWVEGGPDAALMSAAEVRTAAAAGHEIGSHTMTHARMTAVPPGDLRRQVTQSREVLEDVLQEPVDGFAYPYGSFNDAAVQAVRDAGYTYACATDDHTRRAGYSVARIFVGRRDRPLRLQAKLVRHRIRGWTGAASPSAAPSSLQE
jgi:peptidoglycan/xylan/chitin deacetylase (PgdA/CDA1 family)